MLRNRQVQLITVGYFCANFVFYFFFNWLFIYLIESRGLPAARGRLVRRGSLDGRAPSGRCWAAGCAIGCGSGSGRGAAAASRVPPGDGASGALPARRRRRAAPDAWRWCSSSLCLGPQQFTDAIYWAATIAVAGRRASAACGVMNTGGNIVEGIVALMVPLIVDRLGWAAALAAGAAFAFIAAALWLVTAADRQVASESAAVPAEAVA